MRIGEKTFWIQRLGNAIRVSCGMPGEADLTPEEAEQAAERLLALAKEIRGSKKLQGGRWELGDPLPFDRMGD